MIRSIFLEEHAALCSMARNLVATKIKDYSGEEGCVFSNFSKVEQLGICTTETGLLARMADKFGRMTTYVNSGGQLVGDEKLLDTVLDYINYLIFLYIQISRGIRVNE